MAFTGSLFNLFFVAIVAGVHWSDTYKISDLHERASAIEKLGSTTVTSAICFFVG